MKQIYVSAVVSLYSGTVVAHPTCSVVCWVQRINRHILCTWQTISLIIDVLVLHPTDKPDSWAKFTSQKVMKTSSPTPERSTENSLWGWFFVCVYFFRSENNVNIYENDIQLSDRCQGLVLFGLPFQTTILSIQTRFQTDLWSRTRATSARWVNSLWQTVRHVSQAQNVTTQKTLPVWCIRPQNFWFLLWNSSVCSSVKFLARITLLKWCNCNFPHKRGSLSDSKLFLEISC